MRSGAAKASSEEAQELTPSSLWRLTEFSAEMDRDRGGEPSAKISRRGEFEPSDDAPDGMPVAGQIYPAATIQARLKEGSAEPWTRPYWTGLPVPRGDDVADFVFTPTHWHYGWRSNKHTNKSRHTCRIYVFAELGDDGQRLLCLAATSDGAFTISSTKKRQP